ncbi:pyrroloquinoline quinone biosynthesis protein PqqD [Saccharothrix coeruleofusca]|uniref:Pyrroloquinoline quinone biosynthesis protein PqqD n=1 Tax=Saccharothrix coeruleofusca TaxID=33919 RepID=A0A918AMV2_9PSEU|nr:pyrroloquinoline quinone biosynthesis protein PqqD [Saccharothrix coeruleofusca]
MDVVPRLRPGVKRSYDEVRRCHVVLFPEGVLVLNETAAAVVGLCDGRNSVRDIAARLAAEFDGVRVADVVELVGRLAERRVVELRG